MSKRFAIPCRSCGSSNVEIILDLGAQPHCNRLVRPGDPDPPHYPLRLGFCHDCTLVQIDHTIPKEEMFHDYPYVSGTTATLKEHFRDSTERISNLYRVGVGDLIVDIGSNDGTWLNQWLPECRVVGIEPDEAISQQARDGGISTLTRFFDERTAQIIKDAHGPAKIITAAGVFFHLEELHSVVRGCELLLADDGVLIVQAIYLGDMIANTAFDQIYHEHLCYYTLRSISKLLEGHALQVFHVEHLPVHGGSMEYHIAKRGARLPDRSVVDTLGREFVAYHGNPLYLTEFARKTGMISYQLRETLCRYHEARKSVWAYGAPAKGATLLNSFDIGPSLVQCAVEKNPMKVGLEIPGCRIPIVAESNDRPDAYLMLAWNFLDEFIEKERDWLKSGGEFIVPIPEVRVIRGDDV